MSDNRPQRPIKLTIAALGGQGGGVLADWLIEIAEAEGYLAQSTSVPGVAQRTGATIYYLEFFPRAVIEREGREPIMALMPVPGDVDCVVASELAEAGRMIQRGLVSPDRTTLIASSHRSYTIGEKTAMGSGAVDSKSLTEIVRSQAKRLILFDMEAVAEKHQSVISSVLLGALCGSSVLPFRTETFAAVIKHGGIAVATNLAAFEAARQRAAQGEAADSVSGAKGAATQSPRRLQDVPARARSPELQPLLDRVRRLPEALQPLVLEGVRRTIDYQDPAYAALYLDRTERVVAVDAQHGPRGQGAKDQGAKKPEAKEPSARGEGTQIAEWGLSEATARGLALWMTFEDTIRVADLKTRSTRFTRVREEIRAENGQIFGITEFMKPRVVEIAGTLPAGMGRRLLGSPRLCRWLTRWTGGRQVRTSTMSGFLLLHMLGGLRHWRRGTLRYQEENARIEQWLAHLHRLAAEHYPLAVELARAQRLIKGYGETHERGWRNFTALVDQLDGLASRPDGAALLARLQEAALADEEGKTLARELEGLKSAAGTAAIVARATA